MNENVCRQYSSLSLAYMGDSVYEVFIRTQLLKGGDLKVKDFHKRAKNYVSAKAQCVIFNKLEEFLSEEELLIYKRGRNTKVNTKPKNTDLREYHTATGFEALIGYLYLSENQTRLDEILNKAYIIANELINERLKEGNENNVQ